MSSYMADEKSTPEAFTLSFWMDGAENSKLGQAAHKWFSLLGKAASWGIVSRDPLACGNAALDMLAWERGIRRYAGEPERLYRLRVKYAYANGKDAGHVNGWKRILVRLELINDESELVLIERAAGQDWDIIGIEFDDARASALQTVLELIINEYGRTCRRYRFISRIVQGVAVHVATFDEDHNTALAVWGEDITAAASMSAGVFDNDHNTTEAFTWA